MQPFGKDLPPAAFGPMTVPPRTDGDGSLRQLAQGPGPAGCCRLDGAGWCAAQQRRPGHGAGVHGQRRGRAAHRAPGSAICRSCASRCSTGRWTLRCTSSACRSSTSTSPPLPTRARTTRARSLPTCSAARRRTGFGQFPRCEKPGGRCLHPPWCRPRHSYALERAIAHGHYLIPVVGQHAPHGLQRLAPGAPSIIPPFSNGEGWVMYTWWARMPPLNAQTAPAVLAQEFLSHAGLYPQTHLADGPDAAGRAVAHLRGDPAGARRAGRAVPGRGQGRPGGSAEGGMAYRGAVDPQRIEQIKALYGFEARARTVCADAGPVRALRPGPELLPEQTDVDCREAAGVHQPGAVDLLHQLPGGRAWASPRRCAPALASIW